MSTFAALPKLELHLHLEGAAPPDLIRHMADAKGVRMDKVFGEDGQYSYKDFWNFLHVYEAATAVLKTPDDYARLTRAVLEQSAASGVIYTETFLSPEFCGGGDVGAWREYLHAMREVADAAERDLGIVMRGVVTCIRHLGPEKAKKSALCAAETARDWIVGFGMAGDEKICEPKDFSYSFDMAREAELGLTVHAGEWRGPNSVRNAIEGLGVSRIGHGVRAIEDLELVDRLAETGIVLEVCPGSNVALGVYPDIERHPIEMLRERGVKITVSTDDPPFFRTTMADEYEALHRAFGWDEEVFSEINRTALEAAFCDAGTKEELTKRLETA